MVAGQGSRLAEGQWQGGSSRPGLQLGLPGLGLIRGAGRSEVNPFSSAGRVLKDLPDFSGCSQALGSQKY